MFVQLDLQPRNFVVLGHTATISPDFLLDDMAGGSGRLDVLVRCVNTALMLSHGMRRDSQVILVFTGGHSPRCIRIVGSEARNLNPDERGLGAVIKKAFKRRIAAGESMAHPGVYISETRFEELLPQIAEGTTLVQLEEEGDDLMEMLRALPEDALPGVLKPESPVSPYAQARADLQDYDADYEVDEDEIHLPGEEEKGEGVIVLGSKAGVIPLGSASSADDGEEGGEDGGGEEVEEDGGEEVEEVEEAEEAEEAEEKRKKRKKKKEPAKKKLTSSKGKATSSPISPTKPITLVMGDHLDLTPTERAMLKAAGAIQASLGPLSLHADHCITVAHNMLDRRGFL